MMEMMEQMTPGAMMALAKLLAAEGGEWYNAALQADLVEDEARLARMDEGLPVTEAHPKFLDALQWAVEELEGLGEKLTPEALDRILARAEWVPPGAYSHTGPRYARPWE
jgi:hypothetical protein